MVITKDLMLQLLNMDLELEYSSAIQYITHASLITTAPAYEVVSREITMDALEEMLHAIVLAGQITHLGGCPSTKVAQVYIPGNGTEMLAHDLNDEVDAIWRYSRRIQQAEQLKAYDLAEDLRSILAMEQEHMLDFERKDTSSQRERERTPAMTEIFESEEFAKKWAERAAHVPPRIKREN